MIVQKKPDGSVLIRISGFFLISLATVMMIIFGGGGGDEK